MLTVVQRKMLRICHDIYWTRRNVYNYALFSLIEFFFIMRLSKTLATLACLGRSGMIYREQQGGTFPTMRYLS